MYVVRYAQIDIIFVYVTVYGVDRFSFWSKDLKKKSKIWVFRFANRKMRYYRNGSREYLNAYGRNILRANYLYKNYKPIILTSITAPLTIT